MKRLFIVGLACILLAIVPMQAQAITTTIRQPDLHIYMTGKKVKGLQYMLKGNYPSRFPLFKTYKGKLNGRYNNATALAVKNMKYRLGYPKTLLNGRRAGPYFFAVLKKKIRRPVEWIGVQGQRTREYNIQVAKASTCVDEILAAARSVGFGFKETWGSNWGPQIVNMQHITHNSYHAAWCVSFTQWVNVHAGIGPIADASAGVGYVYQWANRRGWVHSNPRPGAWVAFGYSHSSHMGIVEKIVSNGYYSIEGNTTGGVYRRFNCFHQDYPVFIWQPCIVPR